MFIKKVTNEIMVCWKIQIMYSKYHQKHHSVVNAGNYEPIKIIFFYIMPDVQTNGRAEQTMHSKFKLRLKTLIFNEYKIFIAKIHRSIFIEKGELLKTHILRFLRTRQLKWKLVLACLHLM